MDKVLPACTCHVCGRTYKVDLLVSDSLWAQIRPDKQRPPEAGLLCGRCIMDRVEALGWYGAYNLEPVTYQREANRVALDGVQPAERAAGQLSLLGDA